MHDDAHACVEPRKDKIPKRSGCKDNTVAKTPEEIIRDVVEAIAFDTDSGDPYSICNSIIAGRSILAQSSPYSTEATSILRTRLNIAGTKIKKKLTLLIVLRHSAMDCVSVRETQVRRRGKRPMLCAIGLSKTSLVAYQQSRNQALSNPCCSR